MAVMAISVFRTLYRPISDPDTFWHLRLGDYLLSTGTFAGPEPWTAMASRPLVLHEWAPEVLFVTTYRIGGWAALAWLQAVLAVTLLLVMYACSRRFAPPLISAFVVVIGFAGASASTLLRPQIISFMLVAVVTAAWLKTSDDGRTRWWLVPLTWIWACSHGMWFIGVAIGLVVLGGMALERTRSPRALGRLALVPVLSLVAAALTPVGPSLLLTASGMRPYTTYVREWDPPSLFMLQTAMTLLLAGIVAVLWMRSRAAVPWSEIGLWIVGVLLCLMYARTIGLGATVLTIVAAKAVARALSVEPARSPRVRVEVTSLGAVALALAVLGPFAVSNDVDRPDDVPVGLTRALSELPDDTVVYNDYSLGGWLLWEHPELDPVIDGRADVYDIGHFSEVVESYSLAPGWEDTVTATAAGAALLEADSPLAEGLEDAASWTEVARDERYVLLMPPN